MQLIIIIIVNKISWNLGVIGIVLSTIILLLLSL